MNKDENNKKIAEWLGVPCWHEWRSMGPDWGYRCGKNCGATSSYNRNPDYYTPEGFFALLDGLRAKQIGVSLMQYSDGASAVLSAWNRNHAGLINSAKGDDLPTALVEATLQAMEAE